MSLRSLLFALLLPCLLASCLQASPSDDLDDAEKRARIDRLIEEYREELPAVPSMTAEELQDRLASEPDRIVLVDARTPKERQISAIPGAITLEELESLPDRFRDRTVVVYCTIGYRSAEYTKELRKEGWQARNLAGSILAWTHAGGPLVDPQGNSTRKVHVYGEEWNLAADGYEAVW